MTIKEFIEKAIEGGWNKYVGNMIRQEPRLWEQWYETALLDPKAWEAVGKVEGWEVQPTHWKKDADGYELKPVGAHMRMVHMTPHLIDGGTIKSYLETL